MALHVLTGSCLILIEVFPIRERETRQISHRIQYIDGTTWADLRLCPPQNLKVCFSAIQSSGRTTEPLFDRKLGPNTAPAPWSTDALIGTHETLRHGEGKLGFFVSSPVPYFLPGCLEARRVRHAATLRHRVNTAHLLVGLLRGPVGIWYGHRFRTTRELTIREAV